MGSIPVTMPWNDGIYKAMREGTLDGLMVNIDGAYQLKVQEVAPHAIVSKNLWLGHIYLICINKNVWQSLPAKDKRAISRAAKASYKLLGKTMDESFEEQLTLFRNSGVALKILHTAELKAWEPTTGFKKAQEEWIGGQPVARKKEFSSVLKKLNRIKDSYF